MEPSVEEIWFLRDPLKVKKKGKKERKYLHFNLVTKRTSVIPFARVEKAQRYAGGLSVRFLLLVTRAGCRYNATMGCKKCNNCRGFCTGRFMRSEDVLTKRSSDLHRTSYLPSLDCQHESVFKVRKHALVFQILFLAISMQTGGKPL